MDPIHNPYAPGAGTPPPELAGRREVLEAARLALERIRIGRFAKGVMMVGLRGVGKTVLLDRMRDLAEERGMIAVRVEAPDERSLPSILAPALRSALLKLSRRRAARRLAQRALRGLASFVSALKVTYQDLEVGLDLEPEAGLADNGDLETDLPELFEAVGAAARNDRNCVALFIDELQYVATGQLGALIAALHRTAQRQVPVALVGAGLPQLRGRMGKAKSYAERLFEFHEIGALPAEDARVAVAAPAQAEGVRITEAALDAILAETECSPTSCKNGASTCGTLPRNRPSRPASSQPHPGRRSPSSTAVSSWSASSNSRRPRSATCARWRTWDPARIVPARSPRRWTGR